MSSAGRAAILLGVALLLPACNFTFTTDDPFANGSPTPQNPFSLQIPLDNYNGVMPVNTQFAWSALPAAQSYELQISLTSDFAQILYDLPGITITSVFSQAGLTCSSTYYWRVYGFDGLTTKLAAGSPYKFTTVPGLSPPGQFFLQGPIGAPASRMPVFSWTVSPQAAVYSLFVDVDPLFPSPVVSLPILHFNQVTCPVTLAATTTYYWKVFAANSLGQWVTPTAQFTTGP